MTDIKKKHFENGRNYENLKINFIHVPSGQTVSFLPYVTAYEDKYDQQWSPVEVFGRMDAIKNFRRTSRIITLAWDVPSETYEAALANIRTCSDFIKMNYPVYRRTKTGQDPSSAIPDIMNDPIIQESLDFAGVEEDQQVKDLKAKLNKINALANVFEPTANLKNARIITSPPIIGIKYGNFLNDPNKPGDYLYGTLTGMSYKPDLEMGVWTADGIAEKNKDKPVAFLPKVVSFNITFEVIHTHGLGYSFENRDGQNRAQPRSNYPFQTSKRYNDK